MRNLALGVVVSMFLLTGCTATQKGAGVGALIGGGAGYSIGHQSGHGAEGAAIGAAVGAVGGGLIGKQMEDSETSLVCPVCGRTFDSDVAHCPYDGAALQ